ncbi:MAG: hypothetical protein QXJ64_00360 [Thermosphaera sp.]
MSTVETLIALTSFILVLAIFIHGVRTTLHARVLEARQERLRTKGETISQLAALLLEMNPSLLNDRQSMKTFLENNLHEYVHKNVLEGNTAVIQTKITISFPNVLYKITERAYKLQPEVTYYIVNFSSANLPTLVKAKGLLTSSPNDRIIIATADSIYALGFEITSNLDSLQTSIDSKCCYIIHFEKGEICLSTLIFEEDKKIRFNSSCYLTPYSQVLQAENLGSSLDLLIKSNLLRPPYAIVCGKKSFIYPFLYEPLVLFREKMPDNVLFYRVTALAKVNDVVVLIEVVVWE